MFGNFNCVICYRDSAECDIQCRLAAALSLDTPDGLKLKFNACFTCVHLGNGALLTDFLSPVEPVRNNTTLPIGRFSL